MMRYPTGMGVNTGNHYHHVAAQMNAYLNHPHQRHTYPFPGTFTEPSFGTQFILHGAQQMSIHPMIASEISGFARDFVHNLLF